MNNIYPVKSVTRSYARSVHLEKFAADKRDVFASRNHSWFEEPTEEEVAQMSSKLYEECRSEVEAAIQEIKQEATRGKEEPPLID